MNFLKTVTTRPTRHFLVGIFALTLVTSSVTLLMWAQQVQAASLAQVWIRLDRVKASTATTGLVCARTPGSDTGTEADVQVTFPTGFTVSGTAGNWTVATSNIPAGTTAWPGINTATAVSSQTVTFPSTDLAVSTTYCFRWINTAALTTSTAGNDKTGTIETRASGPTTLDTGSYAVSVISEDQITVTATVPSIFNLALSGTSIAHGTLTSGTVDSGSVTATIGTNAGAGWVAWTRAETNAYLNSAGTGGQITSPGSLDNAVSTLAGGTYGWVLDAITTDSANGSGTITQATDFGAEYDGGNTCSSSNTGGTLSTTYQALAASDGTTDADTIELCSLIRVAPYQAAATDYTATLTFTAAGRF